MDGTVHPFSPHCKCTPHPTKHYFLMLIQNCFLTELSWILLDRWSSDLYSILAIALGGWHKPFPSHVQGSSGVVGLPSSYHLLVDSSWLFYREGKERVYEVNEPSSDLEPHIPFNSYFRVSTLQSKSWHFCSRWVKHTPLVILFSAHGP